MVKTKAEAAKVLLEAGWSWDEVKGVLDGGKSAWVMPYLDPFLDPFTDADIGSSTAVGSGDRYTIWFSPKVD